ncbi:MAG: aconitase family protein, partial [Longimicrobiales bacterium]|nr:aconitase family protein [Longimicrobiales bacterium]
EVTPGDIVDVGIDVRAARDFGGANVVKNIQDNALGVADSSKTLFTFDCNPGGSDQKYATNQQICREFAREQDIDVYDIDAGIGTHLAIDNGHAVPGSTFVSTDSHANILGAIGAFGQGMGDVDIAQAFAFGKVWFKVPPTVKIILKGTPSGAASAKDITLALVKQLGANGLLGFSAEIYGEVADGLDLASRITISSMATEMGGIIALFPPNREVLEFCTNASGAPVEGVFADDDAVYHSTIEVDIDGLVPQVSRPGHPEDVVDAASVAGTKIGSAFIGSCTNGRFEDMQAAAAVLEGRKVAPGVVLKIVPSTDKVWRRCLEAGLIDIFKEAGALVSNAGCAGCAAGQVGQNGPGEVTASTGNRNFAGKQGKGEVYLASPAVVAASAVAGVICLPGEIPERPVLFSSGVKGTSAMAPKREDMSSEKPETFRGRVWVVARDNIDTDMIFHNRYLTITDIAEMGQYAFDNLEGWEDFARKAAPGDIVVTGKNFGAGSSRQQAVDCFESLGVSMVIAESFGAIYERNAINKGFPIVTADLVSEGLENGQVIEVDLNSQTVTLPSGKALSGYFSEVQMDIYRRGGLLGR